MDKRFFCPLFVQRFNCGDMLPSSALDLTLRNQKSITYPGGKYSYKHITIFHVFLMSV